MKLIKTRATDGVLLSGLMSEAEKPEGIIIHIHGMSGSIFYNEFYGAMLELYPKNNWSILVGQNRGSECITQFDQDGKIVNIGNAFERFEDCIYDLQAWIDFALDAGYKKIWLQGHSLACSKIAYFLNKSPLHDISGVIFLSPADMLGLVLKPDYQSTHQKLLNEAIALVKQDKAPELLSHYLWGDTLISAGTYLNLFGDNANDAIFNFYKPELGFGIINKINIPVLSITGTKDDALVISVNEAMEMLQRELKNSPRKKVIIYEGAEHSFDGFGEKICMDVVKFLS